jgi:hypothetical protein
MTREEAITIIDNLHLIGCGRNQHENDLKINIALDMAIESLQKDIERHKMVIRASERHLGIVRCKNCKHRSNDGWCDVYIQPRMETDFCNRGERQCNYFGEKREK